MISTHRIMPASHTRQWWLAGGIHPSQVVAAYQPKGAVDLAASYVNLANPGTNDAQVGVEPTLDSSGWVFNGTTQYLIGPLSNSAGFAVRFSNLTNTGFLVGARKGVLNNHLYLRPSTGANQTAFANSLTNLQAFVDQNISSGVAVINGINRAFNGVVAGDLAGDFDWGINYWIGAMNTNGTIGLPCAASVQSCCFFASGTTLTPAQIAALSAAMAAL
jgi:hypothetical protein